MEKSDNISFIKDIEDEKEKHKQSLIINNTLIQFIINLNAPLIRE